MKPTFTLRSRETGTDYVIQVEQTDSLEAPTPRPVVLFMDGDDQFDTGVAEYRKLRAENAVRPLLLVGVGYGASYSHSANRRGRDYTPVAHGDEPSSGGADNFLEFLTKTLSPELSRRYPVDAHSSGIAGHSLGSLLVLHALFQPKPFFSRYLASAPSIWWADRAILAQARALRAQQTTLSAKLFLSVGASDSDSMTGDLTLLENALAEKPFEKLEVVSKRFPERNHYNVLPDAFRSGLAELFA